MPSIPIIVWAVATVLTVYGIETDSIFQPFYPKSVLQQYLPFTVLKLTNETIIPISTSFFRCNSTYRLRY